MAAIMDQLKRDHSHVVRMLAIIEGQLTAVRELKKADFELLRDIMHYMTHYPDRVHHPMEDAMIRRMTERDPATQSVTAVILREHAGLAEKGSAFLDVLQYVIDGGMVRREELEQRGRDYIDFLRTHMEKEDERVFPLAERVLDEADWDAVAAGIEARTDPVFGPVVAEDYERLYQFIRQQA